VTTDPLPIDRRRNHAVWVGPCLTFLGAVSYFTVFVRFPVLRDVPWANIPLVLGGVGLSVVGLWRAWCRPSVFRGKRLGTVGFVVSLILGALFFTYVFHYSYRLPEPTQATLALHDLEDFSLTDHLGRTFRLGDLRGRRVVVVFYRGYW
jgi:hypothetical protein